MLANGNNNGTKLYFCSYFGILQCLFLRLPSPLTRTIDRRHVWKFSRVTISRAVLTSRRCVCLYKALYYIVFDLLPSQSSARYHWLQSLLVRCPALVLSSAAGSSHKDPADLAENDRSYVRRNWRLHSMIGPTLLATAIWRRDERKWHVETETRGSNRGNTTGLVFALLLN